MNYPPFNPLSVPDNSQTLPPETPKPNFFQQFGSNIVDGLTQLGTAAINTLGGGSSTSNDYDYSGGGYSATPAQDNTKYYILGGVLLAGMAVAIYFATRKKGKK